MKVDRALIIRRLRIPESMEMAAETAAGCEKFGIPYEYIDGIEFMTSEEAMEAVGAWINPKQYEQARGRGVSTGNNNCHASHIKAWRRIVEIGKPCVIFEHDVIVKGDVTNVDIVENAVNIFGHRIMRESDYNPVCPIQRMASITHSIGGHAYAFTPKTAEWFIKDVEDNGVNINVDQWINKDCGKPLFITDPPQVVCWPRTSTREWQADDKEHRTLGSTTTFNQSYTPLCRKGYKYNG